MALLLQQLKRKESDIPNKTSEKLPKTHTLRNIDLQHNVERKRNQLATSLWLPKSGYVGPGTSNYAGPNGTNNRGNSYPIADPQGLGFAGVGQSQGNGNQFRYGNPYGGENNNIATGAPWPGNGSRSQGAHPPPQGAQTGQAGREWQGGWQPTMHYGGEMSGRSPYAGYQGAAGSYWSGYRQYDPGR